MNTASRALASLNDHRYFAYRGCAPDPDKPRMSAADDTLPLDAWGSSTVDGGLPQLVRLDRERRAIAICERCPVLDACRTYANTEIPGGGLVEPDGIWGGERSLDRHRALIRRRGTLLPDPAPAHTPVLHGRVGPRSQSTPGLAKLSEESRSTKRRLLVALARETDEELVAYRAGMDVRAANWHRSALCRLLFLDKESATRQQLLETARDVGLLPAHVRIVPDGRWPIVAAPTTDGARRRRVEKGRPVQLALPGMPDYPRVRPTPAQAPARRLVLAHRAPTAQPIPLPVRTMETAAA
ncbi:WhiB family transcriptional regulator [Streptomyces sp. NPDC056069]|uniref:WhiB family transcriptional regulator n=1 Tax=Streptomyces sp. NPDC056069 TaxID=3345702 RepID=UPI0035DC324E